MKQMIAILLFQDSIKLKYKNIKIYYIIISLYIYSQNITQQYNKELSMLRRDSQEQLSLTSITIRQKFRQKRRSEQTQNFFRQIRKRFNDEQQRRNMQENNRNNRNCQMQDEAQNSPIINKHEQANILNYSYQNQRQNVCSNANYGNYVNNGKKVQYLPVRNQSPKVAQIPKLPRTPSKIPPCSSSTNQPSFPILLQYKNFIVYKQKIGFGAYSNVYLGYDSSQKTKVAIKQIQNLQQKQIKVLKSIDSPYIIKLRSHWKDKINQKTYLVLDLCQRNLRQELKKGMSYEQKVKYIEQIVYGMDELFKKNLIHRDLKLQNVLITSDKMIKITDFGFARDLGCMSQVQSLRCGTPYTMAPQIYFDNGYYKPRYNQKCDIWSLAIILHEMLYTRHPFDYKSQRMRKMQRVDVHKQYGYLDQLIDRALVKNPGNRIGWSKFKQIFENKGQIYTPSKTRQQYDKRLQEQKRKKQQQQRKKQQKQKARIRQQEEAKIKRQEERAQRQKKEIQRKKKKDDQYENRKQKRKKQEDIKIQQEKKIQEQKQKQRKQLQLHYEQIQRQANFNKIKKEETVEQQRKIQIFGDHMKFPSFAPIVAKKNNNLPRKQSANPIPQQKRNNAVAHKPRKQDNIPDVPVDIFKNSSFNIVQKVQNERKQNAAVTSVGYKSRSQDLSRCFLQLVFVTVATGLFMMIYTKK